MRDVSSNDYVYFVLSEEYDKNASVGFSGYTDLEGNFCYHSDMKDKNGQDIRKKYRFNSSHKMIKIHKNKQKEIDFLKGNPQCMGSPNGTYQTDEQTGEKIQLNRIMYSVLDNEKDAEVVGDRIESKMEAMNKALELNKDDDLLTAVGRLFGYVNKGPKETFVLLYKHAENNPDRFLSTLSDPMLKARIMFHEGLNKGVIKKNRLLYKVGDIELGIDQDSAVKTIYSDEDIKKAIEIKLGNS